MSVFDVLKWHLTPSVSVEAAFIPEMKNDNRPEKSNYLYFPIC